MEITDKIGDLISFWSTFRCVGCCQFKSNGSAMTLSQSTHDFYTHRDRKGNPDMNYCCVTHAHAKTKRRVNLKCVSLCLCVCVFTRRVLLFIYKRMGLVLARARAARLSRTCDFILWSFSLDTDRVWHWLNIDSHCCCFKYVCRFNFNFF